MPEASLKQLIDALRKDGVLNNLQKEEILQKNPVRADKARDLLDYVKNQGENACKKMIEHFKAIDPALSSDLDFSPAHPLLKVSEVEKIRCNFVDRMPEASLKQLIDALRKDGVLNNLQKEEILQKNPVRADKARDLLDYVKNQGENACKKMIEHFKAIEPVLSSDLGVSPAHPLLKGEATHPLTAVTVNSHCLSL
ncbi:unnamed protein product [Menidia menidia]|uniref:(Atlantic silverside) hypothetical protein n=1 Tax=Menidia menidia TaxID=238744 RepID=A0A8S4BVU9_9TELE|nr:unnamed protein product [Menidia menidia]